MTRLRKKLLLLSGVAILAAGAFVFLAIHFARVDDGRTPEVHRRIAEACLTMLRSPLGHGAQVQPDDPRLPEIIRRLQATDITIEGNDVVIMRSGKPAEYHFSRLPGASKPWVLYVAGPGYSGHRELIRLDHE